MTCDMGFVSHSEAEAIMKRRIYSVILAVFPVLLAAVSCGPSAYVLGVETSRPSLSGVDLSGKTLSVVYLDDGQSADSLFAACMASSFVASLEDEYFHGDSIVPLFCLDKAEGTDYSSRAEAVDILMDTGADVLFVLDSPVFGTPVITKEESGGVFVAEGAFPFSVSLYVYDSMDKRDTVRHYTGSSVANASAQVSGTESMEGLEFILKNRLEGTAASAGRTSGSKFAPVWRSEEIIFFLYDTEPWYQSYYYVNEYMWKEAMDQWMSLLDTNDLQKKACLEYNLAAACYIQGQYGLADEWLRLSASHFDLQYAGTLRQKIAAKLAGND